jgi:F0F1-type ATP synthase membrane subunit c/vacuolar-type H+-ATPase subunit K
MVQFLAGLIVGIGIGILIMAVLVAASRKPD